MASEQEACDLSRAFGLRRSQIPVVAPDMLTPLLTLPRLEVSWSLGYHKGWEERKATFEFQQPIAPLYL
jgi:hypothetical protein